MIETIDFKKLKRDPAAIKQLTKQKGNSIIVTKDLRVVFPERFINKTLAVMGSVVEVVAMFAVLDTKGNYAVTTEPVTMRLHPSNIRTVSVGGKPYKSLVFYKGDIFTPDVRVPQNTKHISNLYEEIILNGRPPLYFKDTDISSMFVNSALYAGSTIGDDKITMELLTAFISRDKKDLDKSFRLGINKSEPKEVPAYVGLSNIFHSLSNTSSKLLGGYFSTGVPVAINKPETSSSKVSKLLRA